MGVENKTIKPGDGKQLPHVISQIYFFLLRAFQEPTTQEKIRLWLYTILVSLCRDTHYPRLCILQSRNTD